VVVDVLVRGGRVATANVVVEADLAITGEVISAICDPGASPPAHEVVDARGAYVLPGVIDPHVHFNVWNPMVDDFETAAISAAHGGVTTIIPFVGGKEGMGVAEALDIVMEEGTRASVVDFAMHCRLRPDGALIDQIPDAFARGVTSVKMFLDYRKRGLEFDDKLLLRAMEAIAGCGGLAMVHAENGGMIDHLEDTLVAEGKTTPEYYLASRPHATEAESVARAIRIAGVGGCALYVVHLSTAEGLEEIARARGRGARVFAETCPQYLLLTDAELSRQQGLAKVGPPLRWDRDREALWRGLQQRQVQTIGSDHAPFTVADKRIGATNIFEAAFGMPGLETILPLIFTEGVARGRLSIVEMTKVLSENSARIFGLYPRKGVLAVGSDADVLVWDPAPSGAVAATGLHSRAGYTCFEGWPVTGRLVLSMLRGRTLVRDGRLCQAPGFGRFLPRAAATRAA